MVGTGSMMASGVFSVHSPHSLSDASAAGGLTTTGDGPSVGGGGGGSGHLLAAAAAAAPVIASPLGGGPRQLLLDLTSGALAAGAGGAGGGSGGYAGALSVLIKGLPEMLLRQFEYEDPVVRGGKHLLHSPFFKELVALACDLGLDALLCSPGETAAAAAVSHGSSYKWAWFKRYCTAARVAYALIGRRELPQVRAKSLYVCMYGFIVKFEYFSS